MLCVLVSGHVICVLVSGHVMCIGERSCYVYW